MMSTQALTGIHEDGATSLSIRRMCSTALAVCLIVRVLVCAEPL